MSRLTGQSPSIGKRTPVVLPEFEEEEEIVVVEKVLMRGFGGEWKRVNYS
jgi:hypothetical protein